MGKVTGFVSSSARTSGKRRVSFAFAVVLASVMGASALTSQGAAAGGPPSGAAVPGAVEIRRLPFVSQLSTVDRPPASNGADCAGNGHAIWYAYPARKAATLIASTAGSDFDTTLSAYTVESGLLTQIVCNDDAAGSGGLQSLITFDVAAGQTVYIMAASCCEQDGGNLKLNVTNAAATGPGGEGCTKRNSRSPSGRCGPAAAYYLAVGDSVPVWNGTDSYPDQILRSSVTRSVPGLKLVNVACSSETSATFIADSVCGGSQLARAVDFLKSNQGHVALITIDIGGNDVLPCASLSGIDWGCATVVFGEVQTNLRTILRSLREAAGPSVPLYAMNYYNPFLGYDLIGPAARPLILQTVFGQQVLNNLLEQTYAEFGVPVADVDAAFKSTDLTTIVASEWGNVPLAVERACTLLDITCITGQPESFGDDPNVKGATLIAETFESLIGRVPRPKPVHRAR